MNRKRIARSIAITIVVVYSFITSATQAQGLLTDQFDSYTNGTLSGQGGWTAAAPGDTPIQVAGGSNKYVQINSSGQDEFKGFVGGSTPLVSGELHTILHPTVSAAQPGGDFFQALSDSSGRTYQQVYIRSAGTGFQLGLSDTGDASATIKYGTNILRFNESYDVDLLWELNPGPNNDTFALLVNFATYLTYSWTSSIPEPTNLAAFNLRQGSAANAATLQLDDVTVGLGEGGGIVPEPSALACLGIVYTAMARRCRRR